MRQLLLVLVLVSLCLGAHNIRHNKLNKGNLQKTLLQTNDVQYIDDDATYQDPQETNNNIVEQNNDDNQNYDSNSNIESDSSEITLSAQEQDALDLEEQRKYEEEKQQQLEATVGTDEDNYMNALNISIQEQDPQEQMPVDVVENQLNPQFEKDPIPDQKGVDSPFQPADGSYLLAPEEPEFEVKPVQQMEGDIQASEVESYMANLEAQSEQQYAILAAQGPR